MANFDKIAKIMIEENIKIANSVTQVAHDTAVLKNMAQNQEIIIAQNKKMIELLDAVRSALSDHSV